MPSYATELGGVSVPVSVVCGGVDQKFVTLGLDLASRIPKAAMIVVEGSGHNLPLERPDAVASAIVEGLNDD